MFIVLPKCHMCLFDLLGELLFVIYAQSRQFTDKKRFMIITVLYLLKATEAIVHIEQVQLMTQAAATT